MTNTINFTKETLSRLPLPEKGKRAVYLDAKGAGLQLRVTDTGVKAFSVYRRVKGGSPERITLGRFPDMTVEQARREAGRIATKIGDGVNPAELKRVSRGELTFGELFAEYGERHGQKLKSWNSDQSRFENHLQGIAKLKLSQVTKEKLSRLLSDLEKAGKAGATVNLVKALVSTVFNRGIEWGYASSNPTIGIKGRAKVKRDRFLQADELPRFFKSLAVEPNETFRDYIVLALLTGARRSNLLEMRWQDVNLDEGIWRIPITKNGSPQNLPLTPEAIAVLLERQRNAEENAVFVFPGEGASGHIEEPKKAVIRIMQRAGIPYGRKTENGVTLHDLRRTLGSWQAKTGASLAIIGKSLNHQSPQATAIYARLDVDPVRQSMSTATAAMMEAGGIKAEAEIVPIKPGKCG